MKVHETISAGYSNVLTALEGTLEGMTEEDLNWQPAADSNSIGWLAWHLTRVQDALIGGMAGEEQLWIKDGWHEKFNRPADPRDVGAGHGPEDVAAFKSPGAAVQMDYQRAVQQMIQKYFATLTEEELDKPVDNPRFQPTPNGAFLMLVLNDSLQHAGQAAYVRGLRQGKGWFKI
jgi:uncharacterized damage-inducible protein DinB